jgi:hypothetical protein
VETPSDAMPTIHGTSFRGFIIPLNYHRFRWYQCALYVTHICNRNGLQKFW